MSTIKRYTVDMKLKEFGMVPILKKEDEGEVVLFSDHEAEVEKYKRIVQELVNTMTMHGFDEWRDVSRAIDIANIELGIMPNQ